MKARYEYKFVRLGEGRWASSMVKNSALEEYQSTIHDHAKEGWRLVQIFAPSIALDGLSKFIECIFERELE